MISKRRATKSKPRHSFTVPSFLAMPVILKLEVQDCAYAGSRGRAGPDVLLDGAVESVARGQECVQGGDVQGGGVRVLSSRCQLDGCLRGTAPCRGVRLQCRGALLQEPWAWACTSPWCDSLAFLSLA